MPHNLISPHYVNCKGKYGIFRYDVRSVYTISLFVPDIEPAVYIAVWRRYKKTTADAIIITPRRHRFRSNNNKK